MINYEEELKKFHPSLDVNEAEDAIYNRDFTDVTDILKELINDESTVSEEISRIQKPAGNRPGVVGCSAGVLLILRWCGFCVIPKSSAV